MSRQEGVGNAPEVAGALHPGEERRDISLACSSLSSIWRLVLRPGDASALNERPSSASKRNTQPFLPPQPGGEPPSGVVGFGCHRTTTVKALVPFTTVLGHADRAVTIRVVGGIRTLDSSVGTRFDPGRSRFDKFEDSPPSPPFDMSQRPSILQVPCRSPSTCSVEQTSQARNVIAGDMRREGWSARSSRHCCRRHVARTCLRRARRDLQRAHRAGKARYTPFAFVSTPRRSDRPRWRRARRPVRPVESPHIRSARACACRRKNS